MIDIGYQNAWKSALKLARHENHSDLPFRRYCLWFVVDTGPDDLLEETIKYLNNLEAQILDNDLKKWMLLKKEKIEAENAGSEVDAAAPLKRLETKELMPKILATSSKLVMNSTLSVIDMAKNRDFWSGNLKSFLKTSDKISFEVIDDLSFETRGDVQSFPCFYESLHENAKLSNLDTKYNQYSIPKNRNDELKLFQTLLRVAMLKESSTCGGDTNDISQCEDCSTLFQISIEIVTGCDIHF